MSEKRIVAKFGGSSMAKPDLVARRIDAMEVSPNVVVVSAAGKDEANPIKMTDMLLAYDANKNSETRGQVLHRLASVATSAALSEGTIDRLVWQAGVDMDQFLHDNYPLAALGERWSAKLLAELTGRTYLEATDVVRFNEDGLDITTTTRLMRQHINPDQQYVMPGFYGATEVGDIRTLDRGGSDVSGALCALALRASEYQNWSDIDGFYTANPREVKVPQPIPELTYREARELANGGSELLHREVGHYLVDSGIPTRMFSTMSGVSQTTIMDRRDVSREPLVGVSGMRNMIELSHDEFGSEEQSGTSVNLYKTLKRHGIPYVHSATSTDTVSVYIDGAYEPEVRAAFADDSIEQISALHIVGQRLVEAPIDRTKVIGGLAVMLAQRGVALRGFTDAGRSPATTLFVAASDYDTALEGVNDYVTHQGGERAGILNV